MSPTLAFDLKCRIARVLIFSLKKKNSDMKEDIFFFWANSRNIPII